MKTKKNNYEDAKFLISLIVPAPWGGLRTLSVYIDDPKEACEAIRHAYELWGKKVRIAVMTKENGAEDWHLSPDGELVLDGPVVPKNLSLKDLLPRGGWKHVAA